MRLKTKLAAVALALAATGANAATMHYDVTEASTVAINKADNGSGSMTDWEQAINVAKYNLGYQLTGVSIKLTQVVSLTFDATNNSNQYTGQDATRDHPVADGLSSDMTMKLYASGNLASALSNVLLNNLTSTFAATGVIGTVFDTGVKKTFSANDQTDDHSASWDGSSNTGVSGVSASDLLAYFTGAVGGSDSVALDALATGVQSNHMNNNFTLTNTSWAQALVDVTYYYDVPDSQTPEPATLALSGLGLLAALGIRRRRIG